MLPPEAANSYYPSTVVNFSLRFDEALLAGAEVAAGVSTEQAVAEPATIPGKAFRSPDVVGGASKGSTQTSFVLNRVPKRCHVDLPSSRQAGTFDMEIAFTDLPIDPRTIRSAGVEIHMGTVSPENFARGMTQTPDTGQQRPSILRPVLHAQINPNAATLVMIGVVDEWEISYDDDETTVSIRGRDLRGVLLDSPLQMRLFAGLNMDDTIDGLVRQIINKHPQLGNMQVEVAPPNQWPGGRIPQALPDSILPRHRRGARGQQSSAAATPPGGGDMTYWDAIVRLCFLVGAIPYFSARTLMIKPSRSYFEQAESLDTPFNPNVMRTFGDMEPFNVRRLVYGRDVEKLSFKRTLGGLQKPKVVRCVAVDLHNRARAQNREVEARWPPVQPRTNTQRRRATARGGATATPPITQAVQDAANNRVAPSGDGNQSDMITIPVHGIVNEERLRAIARSLFEEIGRNEFTGTASTKNYASLGGSNEDPDLLRLRPGDAIEFFVDVSGVHDGRESVVSTATDHFRRPANEVTQEIAQRLGNRDLARAIMATLRGSVNQIQNYFRVSSVSITWSDSGFDVAFDFQNYFVLRNQLNEPVAATTTRRRAAPTTTQQRQRPNRPPTPAQQVAQQSAQQAASLGLFTHTATPTNSRPPQPSNAAVRQFFSQPPDPLESPISFVTRFGRR